MSDDADIQARMARMAKEREAALGGTSTTESAAPPAQSDEDAEMQERMDRMAQERAEQFGIEDTTPRENAAMLEARRVAAEKQAAAEARAKSEKDAQLNTAINLGVAGAGALAGAGYRDRFSAPVDMGSNNMYTRWLERKYNLPAGSWELYQKQQQLYANSDPALNATIEELNRRAAANAPLAEASVVNTNVLPDEKTSGMYRSMLPNVGDERLMPSDTRLAQVTSTRAGDPTGLPNLVVENAKTINTARNLGYDPLQVERHGEAKIILPPKTSKQIALEVGAADQAQRPADYDRVMGTPIDSSRGAAQTQQTTSAARTPLQQVADNLNRENLTAAKASAKQTGKNAGRALGFMGGAITAEQAYHMAMDYLKNKVVPDWTQWTSLAGGPLATFGGRRLGPLGVAMQAPYIYKHHEDIAKGLTMGDVMPYGTFSESERGTPTSKIGR
jgi:hypothetical protein